MRRKSLLRKLNGFQKADKKRFLLLTNKVLTATELVLYEFLVAITDWDETHTETYGTVEATNIQIAEALGWEADSTAYRHKERLIRKGFLFPTEDGVYRVKGFEEWKLKKTYQAKKQGQGAELQPSNANKQDRSAAMQGNAVYNNDYSLVSSKDNISFSEEDKRLANDILAGDTDNND